MFKYARTKEFIVGIQPGEKVSESIPIKGATNVLVTRLNTTNSFSSGSSYGIYLYVSQDGTNFRKIYNNGGFGTYRSTSPYFGADQNTAIYDYNVGFDCVGFNYLTLNNSIATCTATALFKVMVIS